MRTTLRATAIALLMLAGMSGTALAFDLRDGDIVFQTSRSEQSAAVRLATGSQYTHVGIVFVESGRPLVLEAVEPVKLTPFDEWSARGEGGRFVVKRLIDADTRLGDDAIAKMLQLAESFLGRHYDPVFSWTDDRLYCSELVWKIYQRALGVELGRPQPFGSFELSDPLVQEKLRERFHGEIPTDEPVISPAALFASPLLVTVAAIGQPAEDAGSKCSSERIEAGIEALLALQFPDPVYIEDGAADGTIVWVPPEYRCMYPQVAALVRCGAGAISALVDHLDDPRPSHVLFKGGEHWDNPVEVPLGYLCLDVLLAVAFDEPRIHDPERAESDGLGASIRPPYYFRPDAFRRDGAGFRATRSIHAVKTTWRRLLRTGTLTVNYAICTR